jgi:hypothetical protein
MAETPVITSAVSNAPGIITVAWAHSGNDGPLSFRVERTNPSITFGFFTNNVGFYTDKGLQPSTSYSYRVCVLYPDGNSACSEWATVQTMPPEQPVGELPPPTVTAQQITSDSITIKWSCAKKYGHVHILWRPQAESRNRAQIRVEQDGRPEGSRRFGGLAPNTPYVFGMQGCNTTLLGSSCGGWGTPVEIRTAAPQPSPSPPPAPIYAVRRNRELWWNRHDGNLDGSFRWALPEGRRVGIGWDVLHAFSGGDGVVYAVTTNGDLLWNRHEGRGDGTFRWALPEGRLVGRGWQGAAHVFAGHGGTVYAVYNNGRIKWNRHDGRGDGTFRWSKAEGKDVGNAATKSVFWRAARMFASGGAPGVMYAVMDDGDLLWFRHLGWSDGTDAWVPGPGRLVGSGWRVTAAFGLRDTSYVYAVTPDGQLLWNRHDGWDDGSFRWALPDSKPVGVGWNVVHAFSG